MKTPDYISINREFWNHRAEVHFGSDFYDNSSFLEGRNSLNNIELAILGDQLAGQRVLHLQCHFGQDTLSLARMGAEVTGIDLSEKAIEKAKSLQHQMGLNAEFICCDVLKIDEHLNTNEPYDLIFASYGAIGWLPELKRWGQLISQYLKPGGRFVFAEFHPVLWMLNDEMDAFDYSYFNKKAYLEESQGSYASPEDKKKHQSYYWNHSLADVFSSLLEAGLTISHFSEYDYSPYDCFEKTVKTTDGYQIEGLQEILPMVFALEAVKEQHENTKA